jgi:hypothetical protein
MYSLPYEIERVVLISFLSFGLSSCCPWIQTALRALFISTLKLFLQHIVLILHISTLEFVEPQIERADGPALRPDGPRSGQSAPVGRTVRACAEQFRVPSFVLCLLARFAELARNPVV